MPRRKLSLWHIWKTKKKGSGPNQSPGHRETSRCSQWPVCACLIHPVVHFSQEHPNTSAAEKYQDSPCWTWATQGSGVVFTVAWHIQVACSELLGKALSSAVTLVALTATLYWLRIICSINTTFFSGLCGLSCGWKFHGVFPMQEAQYSLWVLSFSPGYYCP